MNSDFTPHIWYNAFMKERGHIQGMTDNELLLAISNIMDKKLKSSLAPIENRLSKIELTLENDIKPRLQNIESCYTSTYDRYRDNVEGYEAVQNDIELLKKAVTEHSEKLQRLA